MKEKQITPVEANDFKKHIVDGKKRVKISNEEIELLISVHQQLEEKLNQICHQLGFPIKDIVPVGSSQRKTFLPGFRDIDIFVRFDTKDRFYLVEFAEKVIPNLAEQLQCKFTIKYAENPFGIIHYQIDQKTTIDVDIVATIYIQDVTKLPEVLKISGMARTPFHAFYLSRKIKGLEEEVRLFKYWCKKKKLYRQNGFTGFIIELLTIIYGSFPSILENANEIAQLTYDFHNRPINSVKEHFKDALIIIIDPVDKHRNAAAGIHGILGKLHLKRFIKLAAESLAKPDSLWRQYVLSGNVFTIEITFKEEIMIKNNDELYSRLGKLIGAISKGLKNHSIEILDVLIETTYSQIEFSTDVIGGKMLKKRGPPSNLFSDNVEKFKQHKNVWEENGYYWTMIKQLTVPQIVNTILEPKKDTIIKCFSFFIQNK